MATRIVECPKCGRTAELMTGQVAYCNLEPCLKRSGAPVKMKPQPNTS